MAPASVKPNSAGATTSTSTVSAVSSSKVPPIARPLAGEPEEVASNINYHAQFSPHFSPFKFEPEQAYFATAESVRDRLIQVTNFFIIIVVVVDINFENILFVFVDMIN